MDKKGKLILVTTPIGNLEEMTPRAISILKEANVVAAEDTRVSRKLMNHFGIETRMVSYHKHNEKERAGELVARMLMQETVALISDAGIPCISDPGLILVQEAIAAGIEVLAVGCGSAALHALVVSGLPTQCFSFRGFLPKDKGEKRKFLEALKKNAETLIFYVSPHALKKELAQVLEVFGDRQVSLSRELTKYYEETRRGSLSMILSHLQEASLKGEMVLVVAGEAEQKASNEEAYQEMLGLIEAGLRAKDAAAYVARKTDGSKRELYNRYLEEEIRG